MWTSKDLVDCLPASLEPPGLAHNLFGIGITAIVSAASNLHVGDEVNDASDLVPIFKEGLVVVLVCTILFGSCLGPFVSAPIELGNPPSCCR